MSYNNLFFFYKRDVVERDCQEWRHKGYSSPFLSFTHQYLDYFDAKRTGKDTIFELYRRWQREYQQSDYTEINL